MTIEKYDKQDWGPGMVARYHTDGLEYRIAGNDFPERLVGLVDEGYDGHRDKILWVRCENVTITGGPQRPKQGD